MLQPKRTKYRKQFKGRNRGVATRCNEVNFGEFGLKAAAHCPITARQIEAARVALTRRMKRQGKVWIRVFPHKSLTATSAETRMGGGKGMPSEHVAVVKPGRVLFEIEGVTELTAKEAMRLASHKLPLQTRFVSRERKGVPE